MASKKIVDTTKSGGRIRFVLFESDGVEGDLNDVANAFLAALRSPAPPARALPARKEARDLTLAEGAIDVSPDAPSDSDEEMQQESHPSPARTAATPRKKYIKKVKVLPDVDLKAGATPFEQFMKEKKPQSMNDKYLAIATWFKRFGGLDTITADHVYTGYRAMGWTSDAADMSQPFRDLKKLGRGDVKKGAFSINHIGEGVVDKMIGDS